MFLDFRFRYALVTHVAGWCGVEKWALNMFLKTLCNFKIQTTIPSNKVIKASVWFISGHAALFGAKLATSSFVSDVGSLYKTPQTIVEPHGAHLGMRFVSCKAATESTRTLGGRCDDHAHQNLNRNGSKRGRLFTGLLSPKTHRESTGSPFDSHVKKNKSSHFMRLIGRARVARRTGSENLNQSLIIKHFLFRSCSVRSFIRFSLLNKQGVLKRGLFNRHCSSSANRSSSGDHALH